MIPVELVAFIVVAQHGSIEDLRDVAEAGDFVRAGPLCEKLAVGVPEGFFEREKTLSLDEGAFDLSIVYGWVYRVARVLRKMLV
jgi:hypothetical protein